MKNVTRSFEQDVLKSDTPVIVDFYADWCGPCKMLAPILDRVQNNLGDLVEFVKFDTSENIEVSRSYGVSSIPTLILFNNGVELWRISGVRDETFLTNKIKDILTKDE